MKRRDENIESPALGCKVGQAYQIMLGQLLKALKAAHLDITTNDYLIMRAVYSSPGSQQCDIAEMVGKDKASVCRSVAGLVKKGYLYTVAVSHKCLKVYPSEKGRDIETLIVKVAHERHQALLEHISTEELDIFTRTLDKIINSK